MKSDVMTSELPNFTALEAHLARHHSKKVAKKRFRDFDDCLVDKACKAELTGQKEMLRR